MPSPSRIKLRKTIILGLMVAIALVLSYFERFIPINFAVPGVKLGLANVVTLLCIRLYTPKEIYLMVIVRVFLASIFIGSVMSFWYSLAGGLLSTTVMILAVYLLGDKLSMVGVSALGAIFHNIGQLIIVSFVTGSFQVALTYFPMLLVAGIITGVFIGFVGKAVKPYLVKVLQGA